MDSAPHSLWQKSEDAWKTLADEPSRRSSVRPPSLTPPLGQRSRVVTPPPVPREDTPLPIALDRPRGWRLQTPPSTPIPTLSDSARHRHLQSWTRSERVLWKIAGSLMVLALLVVGVLGALTFAPSAPPVALAAAATVSPSAEAPAAAPSSAPAQPMIAARVEVARPTLKAPARLHRHVKAKHVKRARR